MIVLSKCFPVRGQHWPYPSHYRGVSPARRYRRHGIINDILSFSRSSSAPLGVVKNLGTNFLTVWAAIFMPRFPRLFPAQIHESPPISNRNISSLLRGSGIAVEYFDLKSAVIRGFGWEITQRGEAANIATKKNINPNASRSAMFFIG